MGGQHYVLMHVATPAIQLHQAHTSRAFTTRALLIALLFAGIVIGGLALKSTSSQASKVQIAPLFEQAIAAQSARHFSAAAKDYRTILALDPANKFAEYDLGTIYQSRGQSANAFYAYSRALLIDATYTPAMFNLAVLETSAAPSTAAQLYQRIEKLNPTDAKAFFNLGSLYANAGSNALAIAQFKQVETLSPSMASSIPAGLR